MSANYDEVLSNLLQRNQFTVAQQVVASAHPLLLSLMFLIVVIQRRLHGPSDFTSKSE